MFRISGYILFILLLAGHPCFAQEGNGNGGDTDAQTQVIQIRIISQLHMESMSGTRAYLSPQIEYIHFSKALEESLNDIRGDYKFTFTHFPRKTEDQGLQVSIYLHDWKALYNGIIEAHFSARYKYGDEKASLGSFRGDSFVVASPISSIRDQAYENAVLDAGEKFVEKLQAVLDQYFNEGDKGAGE